LVGKCVPKIADGTKCTADDQCTNGHCVDGLCCNSTCDGQCEACDVAGLGGKCSPISDPKPHAGRPACVSDPQYPACAGACDGKNRLACVFPSQGTSCRDAACSNDVATLPASCTGTGTCSPAQTQACQPPNGCDATATICDNGCTSDRDCAINKYCSGGVCVPTLGSGAPCSTSGQCAGACVDGVCCNTTCDHQCEACNLPGKAGQCLPITGAPLGLRQACASDGTAACVGTCNGVNRDACTFPGATTQCSAGSCTSGVATLTDFCDGEGSCPATQNQICAPADCVGTKCGGDCATTACAAGSYCSAGVCVTTLPKGSECSSNAQCANGICTDGFCCNVACNGQCQACDVAGSEGTCTTLTGDLPHGGRAACPGFGFCAAICDGTSPTQCAYASATTTCGKSSCAGNGAQLSAPLCNGVGQCLQPLEANCGAYTCDPPSGACLTSCILDSDCAAGFSCVNTKCVPSTPDAGVAMDSGTDAATEMPDSSVMPDASADATAPDGATDGTAPDSGSAGAADAGTPLVPPGHSTDKGSCGCSIPGSDSGGSNVLLIAGLTLLGIASRRRRRGAARSERDARV
jgi:MYXO-CTERM domain-containing protein